MKDKGGRKGKARCKAEKRESLREEKVIQWRSGGGEATAWIQERRQDKTAVEGGGRFLAEARRRGRNPS